MDTVRARRDCHVESVVHEHPRVRAANRVDTRAYQTRQRPAVQIALTNLNEVYPLDRRGTHPADQRLFPRSAEPSAIGDEAEDRSQLLFQLLVAAERERCGPGVTGEKD